MCSRQDDENTGERTFEGPSAAGSWQGLVSPAGVGGSRLLVSVRLEAATLLLLRYYLRPQARGGGWLLLDLLQHLVIARVILDCCHAAHRKLVEDVHAAVAGLKGEV
jgi:hypothetical protein